jgi:hypothetical protein
MKTEYDFSKGERGKFFQPEAELRLPGLTSYPGESARVHEKLHGEKKPSLTAEGLQDRIGQGLEERIRDLE